MTTPNSTASRYADWTEKELIITRKSSTTKAGGPGSGWFAEGGHVPGSDENRVDPIKGPDAANYPLGRKDPQFEKDFNTWWDAKQSGHMPSRSETLKSPGILPPKTKASRVVDWVALEAGLNSAEQEIVDAVKRIQKKQVDVLVREALKRVESGDLNKLDTISVPYKTEATKAIEEALIGLYRVGQREAQKEIQASITKVGLVRMAATPLDPSDDETILQFLAVRAKTIVSMLGERLRGSMMRNVLDLTRRGVVTREALWDVLNDLSDRSISTEAQLSISEAMNLGRDSAAKANEEIITEATYSAILDNGTCDDCGAADGEVYDYGSDEMEAHRPPYKECQGRGRCRCVLIYTLASEG